MDQRPHHCDLAEERRKHAEETRTDIEAWCALKTRVFKSRDFALHIVGESNYQGQMRTAMSDAGKRYIEVILAREPDNQYDAGAIKAMSGRLETIGYLGKDVAPDYRLVIELWESAGFYVRCQGKVLGGDRDRPTLGVWLDLCEPDVIKDRYHNRKQ